jgi:hypothetical protein
VHETDRPAHTGRGPRGLWRRIKRSHERRLGQRIPPLDTLEDEIDKRIAAGESDDAVTLAVIEDFERSATTVNMRTTPLVPASGIVVTGAGILAREGDTVVALAYFAIVLALAGLGYLATSLFTHAGRPNVGVAPTRADIPFVHERLIKKESRAQTGSILTFFGFLVLLWVLI